MSEENQVSENSPPPVANVANNSPAPENVSESAGINSNAVTSENSFEASKAQSIIDKLTEFFTPAIILVIIIVVAMTWQWYASRQHFLSLEASLSDKIEQFKEVNQQSLALAKNADERSTQASAHTALLEQQLAESQDQLSALQTLYTELANNREERIISEVEQLLVIANQQLQIAGNIKPALLALQTADSRLQQLQTPLASNLRKSLARDIQQLQNLPNVDIVGMSLKLESISDTIDSLPLISQRHPASQATMPDFDTNPWHKLAREIWNDVKSMVRIERVNRTEPPLLAPDQHYFLMENLRLRLLTARIALLQHDQATYRADIQAASDWIVKYFDMRENATRNVLASLKELSSSDLVIDIPDVTESLALVSKYKLVLEHNTAVKSGEGRK